MPDVDDEYGAFDVVVKVLIVAGLVANLWVAWDWIRRDPEHQLMVDKVRERLLTPLRREKDIRRAAKHVVFDATQIVEDEVPWTGP
jgi:hypothetical protein